MSVEQVEERTTQRPDGSSSTQSLKTRILRDSTGRVRVEPRADGSSNGVVVWLFDPVDGSHSALDSFANVAQRWRIAKPVAPSLVGSILPEGVSLKTDILGGELIEGFLCFGVRTDWSSVGPPSKKGFTEAWVSRESGLTGRVEASFPEGRYSVRIESLERGEPDSRLFNIPESYVIQEMPAPGPKHQ